MCTGVLLAVFFTLFRRELILLFNDDPAIVMLGRANCAYRGGNLPRTDFAGRDLRVSARRGCSKYVALTSFVSIALIRPALSWLLCYPVGWGLIGAWIGLFGDQFMRLVLNFIRFRGGKWSTIEL